MYYTNTLVRDQVTAEQVWNVRCLLTITEDRVACHQQIDHFSFNCFLKLPLQCLLVCLFKAMGRASTLFPSTQIFITVPREDSEGALLNLTMRMSRFTLNCLTLLKVSTNIPSGLPVTEAQLARVALVETAACNCLGPCLPSIAFPLDSAGCIYTVLKVVRGCKIGHGKLTEKNHVQQTIVAQSLPADHLLTQSSMLSK